MQKILVPNFVYIYLHYVRSFSWCATTLATLVQRSFPNDTVPLDNTTVSADGHSSVNFPGLSFIDVDVPAYEKQKTKVEKKAFSSIENIECGPKKRLFTREVDSPTKSLQLESCDVNNSKTQFYENSGPIFLIGWLLQLHKVMAFFPSKWMSFWGEKLSILFRLQNFNRKRDYYISLPQDLRSESVDSINLMKRLDLRFEKIKLMHFGIESSSC